MDWAKIKRVVLGIEEPILSRDYLGAVRSTLGKRRDLHTASKGELVQHFPEVYLDAALKVNNAYHGMTECLRVILDVHYVARAPFDWKLSITGLNAEQYSGRLDVAKNTVQEVLD